MLNGIKAVFRGIISVIRGIIESDEDSKDKEIELERDQWGFPKK